MSNLSNLYICFLPHEETNGCISMPSPFEGIDMVLYMVHPFCYNKIRYLTKYDLITESFSFVREKLLWKIAYQNTIEATEIVPFMNVMIVITNHNKFLGASCILNVDAVKSCMDIFKTNKLALMPSSIHETILLPYEEKKDLLEFSYIVKEVNRNKEAITPQERLANKAYLIDLPKIEEIAFMFTKDEKKEDF